MTPQGKIFGSSDLDELWKSVSQYQSFGQLVVDRLSTKHPDNVIYVSISALLQDSATILNGILNELHHSISISTMCVQDGGGRALIYPPQFSTLQQLYWMCTTFKEAQSFV